MKAKKIDLALQGGGAHGAYTWGVIDRLHRINVPTLIISGRHDEATPDCVQPFKDNIKGAKWEIFEQSSHMPHVEEQDKCMKLVGSFLAAND